MYIYIYNYKFNKTYKKVKKDKNFWSIKFEQYCVIADRMIFYNFLSNNHDLFGENPMKYDSCKSAVLLMNCILATILL